MARGDLITRQIVYIRVPLVKSSRNNMTLTKSKILIFLTKNYKNFWFIFELIFVLLWYQKLMKANINYLWHILMPNRTENSNMKEDLRNFNFLTRETRVPEKNLNFLISWNFYPFLCDDIKSFKRKKSSVHTYIYSASFMVQSFI